MHSSKIALHKDLEAWIHSIKGKQSGPFMSKSVERMERAILYSTLVFLATLPNCYMHSLSTPYSFASSVVIGASSALAILYATLCLCYRGYVVLDSITDTEASIDAKGCHICMQFKPERAHHCSSCKRCIKKMDHHCHWLGRCINYDNHGHFIRFLIFVFISTLTLFSFNVFYTYLVLSSGEMKLSHSSAAVLLVSTMLSALLVTVTFTHLTAQLYMVIKNVTFIENLHCKNFDYSVNDSPYSFGIMHNIQEVFGPLHMLLLGMPRGNGIFFKKRYDVSYWPRHISFSSRAYSEVV